MRNFTTQATLVISVPDGMPDQEAFMLVNRSINPHGVDLIWPAYPGKDNPVIIVRILKREEVKSNV